MRNVIVWLMLPLIALSFAACKHRAKKEKRDYNKPLDSGAVALREVDMQKLPPLALTPESREDIEKAIANSLTYFAKPSSDRGFPVAGITRDQVIASLHALDQLLRTNNSDAEFNSALHSRFRALMSIGCDDQGTVLFTGYYTPIFSASTKPDGKYRYPLYKRPKDLLTNTKNGTAEEGPAMQRTSDGTTRAYPDRSTIESSGMLQGSELVWLADPFECYLVQIQGSAKLRMPSGEMMEVGYAGTNGYDYRPIGPDLVADKKIPAEQLSFFTIRNYFRQHPEDVALYTNRNPRYVFFDRYTGGPMGSLGQPVTANVSIATDKSIFPRGAPVLVSTLIADPAGHDANYVGMRLDQDTGGGIRAPGHADLYMGEGDDNERRAGAQYHEGRLYYLIAK